MHVLLIDMLLELGEHYCTESDDGATGGRKDADVCPIGHSIIVQGLSAVCWLNGD